jgi:hypothetical protein
MTSPLRRKRRTTRRSLRRTNSRESRVESREPEGNAAILQSIVRIAACLVVVTMFAATLSAATGGKLEWRSRGMAAKNSTGVQSNSIRPTGQRPVATARAMQINPLRGSQRHVDTSLRQAAFEEDAGPRFAEAPADSLPARSVVVGRNETQNELRSAQAPSSSGGAGSIGAPTGSPPMTPDATGLPDTSIPPTDLETPAIDTTELPPIDVPATTPGLESTPLPEDTQLPPEDQMRQSTDPPARQPSSEFQPRVPAAPVPRDRPGAELPPAPSVPEATIQKEREKSEQACSEGFRKLRDKTIDKVDLSISVTGEAGSDYPFECTLGEGEWHGGRCWEQTTYMWKASALCHKPLYFEDEQLERYGHSFTPCLQPFVSGAHFFTRLPVLPYCMGVEPPTECIYALGHYRPGNCAPYMCNPIPISGRGALIQAGAVVGTAAVVP